MTTMIERVARAAYKNWILGVEDLEPRWKDLPESHRENMMASMRAALAELREPTEAMVDAGWHETVPNCLVRPCWQAMIDAALEEGE